MTIGRWVFYCYWDDWQMMPCFRRYNHIPRWYDWILDIGPVQFARRAKEAE